MNELMIRAFVASKSFGSRFKQEEGAGLAEYALLLVLIAVVVIAFMGPLANAIGASYKQITNALTTAN